MGGKGGLYVGMRVSVQDMPLVEDFLRCAVPILYLDNKHGYHGVGGTAFYVRYRGRVLVVTAGHCIRDYAPDSIAFATLATGPLRWVRVRRVVQPALANPDPHAPYDERVDVTIIEPAEPPDPNEVRILDLDDAYLADTSKLMNSTPIAASGYPRTDSIDYDSSQFKPTQYFSLGMYRGAHPTMDGCHAVDSEAPEQGPDGMSGSPVVALRYREGRWEPAWVGMMLMWSNGRMHFLDVRYLLEHVREACRVFDADQVGDARRDPGDSG